MPQAKGILPRLDDKEVLYKNPRTCGYFISVGLDPSIDRGRVESWLNTVSGLIDELVERLPIEPGQEKGEKVAAVAVGFAPRFFMRDGVPRFAPAAEPPASFGREMPNSLTPLATAPVVDADVMFYVASVFEARVNAFVAKLAELTPDVQKVTLDRGFQRLDETEPFGYRDGIRNIKTIDRFKFVFVHRDGRELEEPVWADGGSYMAFIRIAQHPDVFNAVPDESHRDAVIGRTKDGTRLDLVGQNVDPRSEPSDVPSGLPPTSHVRKVGPRGMHDDVQIFRRGLPFMETTPDGRLRVGLNFCSFQASLEQFDVAFNDWMMNPRFPSRPDGSEVGPDALMDPTRGFATIEKVGFFFVPPYDERGLAAAIFNDRRERDRDSGRLVVHKRVVDRSAPEKRFERGGFRFQVLDAQGQLIPGAEFSSDSTGRAICPVELSVGASFTLQELSSPVQNVQLTSHAFVMDRHNMQLHIVNEVTQPNTPYGA